MAEQKDKNFAAGTFIKPVGQSETMFSIGVKPEEFIEWLRSLPVSKPKEGQKEGFSNLTFAKSKRGKWYLAEDTFVPNGGGNRSNETSGAVDQSEDLPF